MSEIILDTEDVGDSSEPNQIEIKSDERIPQWVKNNARWWSEGNISDTAFIEGIEFLVKIGIIKVS